jgi:hypothetical protein
MKPGCAIGLAIALALHCGTPVASSEIKTLPGREGRVVIQILGRIELGDADLFITTVKRTNAAGKAIENVQLNSTGGRLVEGAKLAGAIKVGRFSTSVGPGAVCASACFLAFAAGEPKFAGDGALIGVHKASDQGGRETALSDTATLSMARFARELGVPSPIIGRMVSTPPRQIVWLDTQDLRSMGVKIVRNLDQARNVAAEKPPAQQLPGESTSLASLNSQPKATTSNYSWNAFIDKAIAISAEQNQGSAAISRLCKPESRECIMTVAYLLEDGRRGLATVIQDATGNVTRREVCESNVSNDARECIDWDTGGKSHDMKNTKGDWVQIVE